MTPKQPHPSDVELNLRKVAAEQHYIEIRQRIQQILGSEPLGTYSQIRWVPTTLDLKGPRFGVDETRINEQTVLEISDDLLVKYDEYLESVLWREAYLLHLPDSVRAVQRAADLGLYCYYRYGLKTRKQRQRFLQIWEAISPPIQYAFYRYFPTGGFAYFDKIVDGTFLHIAKKWFRPFTQLHTPLTEDAYTANLERWMMNFHRILKPVELRILQALYNDPSASQIELADRLGLKQPTVSRVIKVLAEKHFLRFSLVENFPVLGLQPFAVLFTTSKINTRKQIRTISSRVRYSLGIHEIQNLIIVYFVIPFRRVNRFRQWVKQITASLNLSTSKILQLRERSVSRNFRLYQPAKKGWPVDYNPILGNIKRILSEDWTEQLPPLRSFEFPISKPVKVIKLIPEDFVYIKRASDAFLVTSRAKFYEAEEARKAGSGDLSYRRRVAFLEKHQIMSSPLSIGLLHLGLDAHVTVYVKCSVGEAKKILRTLQLLPRVSGNILEDGSVAITLLLPTEVAVSVETSLQRMLADYGGDVYTGIKPAWEAYGWMIRPPVISENYDFEKGTWIWVKDTLPSYTQSI